MRACYYSRPSQNICVSMFKTVTLLFLVMRISSEASSVNRTSANCSDWLPVNVTDVWLSCGAQCNTTRVWGCNDTHKRLVLRVECSSISTGDIREKARKAHDKLLTFLYGAACGAGVLIFIIILLSTVIFLKKKGKKKSPDDIIKTSQASTQGTENAGDPTEIEGDYIRTTFNLLVETQNESRKESSRQALMPPPYLGDIARDSDTEELEYAAPFERCHRDLKKTLKQKHQTNGNGKNEQNRYMHLILETREGNETSNLTTKSSKRSVISRESSNLTSTRGESRASSVAYVNGHLTELYSNVS